MSVINNNQFGPGFPAANGAFDFERSDGNALATALARPRMGSDNVRPLPFDPGAPSYSDGSGGSFGAMPGQSGIGSVFAALLGGLSDIFSQLMSLLNAANLGAQPQPSTGQPAFSNATASSVGDPHESFAGTTVSGTNVSGHWDDTASHHNLLSSDSFDGGYRVSTTATDPKPDGGTLNARADVATDGGSTVAGLKADGSYDVMSFGRHVDLVQGRAVHLGGNETVTLNADRSLTIEERNASGGSIATTLRSNGSGGVDVSSAGSNVDLGGYLVSKNDGDADPVALATSRSGYGGYVPDAKANSWSSAAPLTRNRPSDVTFAVYDIEETSSG